MKRNFLVWVLVAGLIISCGQDETLRFDTPEGKWTYLTEDGKIGVDFELVKNNEVWTAVNSSIRVEGVTYNSEIQFTSLNPPTLQFIRINANDAAAVYNYNIVFNNGVLNEQNTLIEIPSGTYTWPHDMTNNLSKISISRK